VIWILESHSNGAVEVALGACGTARVGVPFIGKLILDSSTTKAHTEGLRRGYMSKLSVRVNTAGWQIKDFASQTRANARSLLDRGGTDDFALTRKTFGLRSFDCELQGLHDDSCVCPCGDLDFG